ncbi:COG4315 family predicted lipoprotein [Streptomyces sp. NPDC001732]
MRVHRTLFAVPLAVGLVACGAGSDGGGREDSGTAGRTIRGTTVTVARSELGSILVDGKGRTLYAFTRDKDAAGDCDAECIAVWPALTSPSPASAGRNVKSSLLHETERNGGAVHVTYGDWPLYYYVGDTAPGDVNGQGLDGEWFAVAPDGKLVRKSP